MKTLSINNDPGWRYIDINCGMTRKGVEATFDFYRTPGKQAMNTSLAISTFTIKPNEAFYLAGLLEKAANHGTVRNTTAIGQAMCDGTSRLFVDVRPDGISIAYMSEFDIYGFGRGKRKYRPPVFPTEKDKIEVCILSILEARDLGRLIRRAVQEYEAESKIKRVQPRLAALV